MRKRPNILYIMSDDHAANAVSCYESRLESVFKTPYIDKIAKEGCRLNNCQCTNNICTPSRASILTGKYAHNNGVLTLDDSLDNRMITFPKLLKESGYQSAVFGKWHVHSEPKGFDDYCVLPCQGIYNDPYFIKKGKWIIEEDDDEESRKYPYPKGEQYKGYVTDIITDMCLEWLDSIDFSKPFLLLCHNKAPHAPFSYNKRDENLFFDMEIPEPDSLFEDKNHRSVGSREFGTSLTLRNENMNMVNITLDRANDETISLYEGLDEIQKGKLTYQLYLKDYLRVVKAIDDNVGRLLDYLEEKNILDDTIVIYTSDQGMFLGEHDYIDKRWIFEEASKMPFVMRYPKEIESNTVIDNIISNIDFAPTLLDFADVDIPKEMDGKSFRKIVNGNGIVDWEDVSYNRYWMHLTHHDVPAHYGIRTPKYKLIYYYGLPLDATGAINKITPESWELYDLENDPLELKNVYNDSKYREIVIELKKLLKQKKNKIGDEDTKYPSLSKLPKNLYKIEEI